MSGDCLMTSDSPMQAPAIKVKHAQRRLFVWFPHGFELSTDSGLLQDVFLEQRSLEDLKRNSLVSVFLRVLEYYEGILILTSNRVGTFDEAFKSRIQLALHYPTLGPYKRGKIWENFLKRLEKLKDTSVDISDIRDHVEQLQNVDMNGRQIRNVITTARQYAKWKNVTLTYKHLKEVIDIAGEFDVYLDGLHGGQTQDELAKEDGVR